MEKVVAAVDLGGSSGRVMAGRFDGHRVTIEEVHRFSNDPVSLGGTLYWDFLRLFHEAAQGIRLAGTKGEVLSIGVDTWGVDFGLIDKAGCLLENPVHYRDGRTEGMSGCVQERIRKERLYQITGIQLMEINTLFQLAYLKKERPDLLERAEKMLMMPDLFSYYLSGAVTCEHSIASTTQLLAAAEKCWSGELLNGLGLPERLFPPLVPSGTVLAPLKTELGEAWGVSGAKVTAVTGHDTECALTAVPASKDFVFISCGTWSLFGTELYEPLLNEAAAARNLANETGYGGRTAFLKNIIGLWLIQESRRQWQREGVSLGFGELEELAGREAPFQSLIDPDAPEFSAPGNVPRRIRNYLRADGQKIPESPGAVTRCIDESLALSYRLAFEEVKACTGKDYHAIHIVGGGAQSRLLCQMTADACGVPVAAGPVEATALGNAMVQFMASGEIGSLEEARSLIAASGAVTLYEPEHPESWNEPYERFKALRRKEKMNEQ